MGWHPEMGEVCLHGRSEVLYRLCMYANFATLANTALELSAKIDSNITKC